MSLWRLVAHVLGLLALAVSGTHGSSGWLAMAVNRDGFVHYDDKWTNSTYYVEANSTGAELLFAYNGYSVDVVTLYHHAVHPTFDIYLDGRAIEPNNMTVTSSLNSSDPREAETNGIISVGDAPGDHQLLLRTTSSVVVFLTGFEIHFNSSSARSSTFGLRCCGILARGLGLGCTQDPCKQQDALAHKHPWRMGGSLGRRARRS